MVDYHIHTPYCGHAYGKTVEYIEKAIMAGMDEICFTDHLGRYYLTTVQKRRYWDWGMNERTISRYVEEISELRELYRDRISIKIGLEIDFIEGAEELLEPFISFYPFDFLLASVHCLPRFGWRHLSEYSEYDEIKVFDEYFRYARAAICSGLFHSLAHPDFIWRYLRWPSQGAAEYFEREIASLVGEACRRQTCIEINANGYIWSGLNVPEGTDPFVTLLSQIREQRPPVTLGSDAHEPGSVGKAFGDIIPVLRSWDITECSVFTEGRRSTVPLG